jgi:hypothetical protein
MAISCKYRQDPTPTQQRESSCPMLQTYSVPSRSLSSLMKEPNGRSRCFWRVRLLLPENHSPPLRKITSSGKDKPLRAPANPSSMQREFLNGSRWYCVGPPLAEGGRRPCAKAAASPQGWPQPKHLSSFRRFLIANGISFKGERFRFFIAEQGAPLRGTPCFSDRRRLRRDLLYDQAVGDSRPLISSAQ